MHNHNGENCCDNHEVEAPDVIAPPTIIKDIFYAATIGDLTLLKVLIEVDKVDVNSRQLPDNVTALHWASLKNHIEAVKYLLDCGAEIDAATSNEANTPLMWACIEGNLQIAHYLLEQGADPHKCDVRGYNALHHAVQYDQAIIEHFLLGKGLFVDSRDNEGHTALMWAAYRDFEESIRYLLSQGADIHAVDNSGFTTLHWAALKGNGRAVKALLRDSNPDLGAKDNNGETPAQMAERKGHKKLAELLNTTQATTFKGISKESLSILWFTVGVIGTIFFLLTISQSPSLLIGIPLAFGMIYGAKYLFGRMWLDSNHRNPLLVGIVISFYSISGFAYFWKVTSMTSHMVTETLLFLVLNLFFVPIYIRLLYSDPGYVSKEDGANEWKSFLSALESGSPLPQFCLSCMARRPIRSKHCRSCHRCVVRFDHHCGWINNCVGVSNHGLFLLFVALVATNHAMFAHLVLNAFLTISDAPSLLPLNVSIPYFFETEPLLFVLFVFHLIFVVWQLMLLQGLIKGVQKNMMTNEFINGDRYDYLQDPITKRHHNPFDKGFLNNLKDIVYPQIDWFHMYHLPRDMV